MRTIVIGAGVAGTAAALCAARAGARVTVVDTGAGASSLATGAIDEVPWQRAPARPSPASSSTRAVLDALAAFALPALGARLVTTAGIVRTARGCDLALLDLGPLAGKRVGIVGCERHGWDGPALARAWGDGFAVLEASALRHADERVLPDADVAARHDDEERVGWLAERLRAALARSSERVAALVLPPFLGVEHARAPLLSRLVGLPCGEALGLPGGPSGLRFEHARNRALAAVMVERVQARATGVLSGPRGWSLATDGGVLEADSLVLAMGGLLGGGVEYAPSEAMIAPALPPFARIPFRLAIDAPVTIGARGRALELPGSLFGVAPETLAHEPNALLECVGILTDADGRVAPGLFAAGELRADRPRTWLDALATGAAAGAAAAEEATTSASTRAPSTGGAAPSRP